MLLTLISKWWAMPLEVTCFVARGYRRGVAALRRMSRLRRADERRRRPAPSLPTPTDRRCRARLEVAAIGVQQAHPSLTDEPAHELWSAASETFGITVFLLSLLCFFLSELLSVCLMYTPDFQAAHGS